MGACSPRSRIVATGVVSTALLAVVLSGCSGFGSEDDASSSTPTDPLIAAAGSTQAIESSAREALRFCHSETKYDGEAIATTYTPNEFQGVYIEDDGNTIRHVIVGTARMPSGADGTIVGGYGCTYLQFAKNGNPPAKDGELNIVMEDNFAPLGDGGDSWAQISDQLRQAHDDQKFVIYPGSLAEITDGLIIDVPENAAGSANQPLGNGNPASGSGDLAATYPSGDPVMAGYPLKVSIDSLDRRVASWLQDSAYEGQVVAVAPGVYTAYSPVEPDLNQYLNGPVDGDCTVRTKFFPGSGGSCWNGVQPGSEEPPL